MMFLTILVLPFLFIGLINKMKALYVGKQGASVFQPYFDFFKLIKKGEVLSDTSSFVFQIAPSVNLACTIIAAVLLTLVHFSGDFILFSYILAVGKFFSVIAAMDTGSSFEGMGASREVSYTSFVEPAFFIIIGSVAALSGHYSFVSVFGLLQSKNEIVMLIAVLAIFAIFMMILIEGSRVPIDDPKTHLELTMIHEVMVLDNSGVDLAFIHYASALKMLLFSALISFIICPQYFWAEILVILFIAFLIATIESIGARIRLTHIIEYTFTMIAVALIVMALVLLIMHGGRF